MCESWKAALDLCCFYCVTNEKTAFTPLHFLSFVLHFKAHYVAFLLPLLAEWHTLKQKCCEVVLSPTSLFKNFFFFQISSPTLVTIWKKKVSFTGNVCHMFHSTFGCILFINKIKVGYMRLFLLVIKTAASELALTHTHMHIHTHECVQCSSSSLLIKH